MFFKNTGGKKRAEHDEVDEGEGGQAGFGVESMDRGNCFQNDYHEELKARNKGKVG